MIRVRTRYEHLSGDVIGPTWKGKRMSESITRKSHPIPLRTPKFCSSGHEHRDIPAEALFSDMGFVWNCAECRTTLHMPFWQVVEQTQEPDFHEAGGVGAV